MLIAFARRSSLASLIVLGVYSGAVRGCRTIMKQRASSGGFSEVRAGRGDTGGRQALVKRRHATAPLPGTSTACRRDHAGLRLGRLIEQSGMQTSIRRCIVMSLASRGCRGLHRRRARPRPLLGPPVGGR